MPAQKRNNRLAAYAWCAFAYTIALAAAIGAGYAVRDWHPLAVIAAADTVGTIVIFAFSFAFRNSSFYDPYWSVAPIAIVFYWLYIAEDSTNALRGGIVTTLVAFWGVRLTVNFLRGWTDLKHEDWRYINLREKNGKAYWLVSFLGIHFAPTAWVYLGCLALYPAMTSGRALNPLDFAAFAVTFLAILIETVADEQLRAFRRSNPPKGSIMAKGLWARCRHPNYLGEVGFWWGLFLFGLAADPARWWTIAGPLGITLLFVFISIPMIDKRHLERRPGYDAHIQEIPGLLPKFWKPRKSV